MATFKKGDEVLITSNETQARAFISAGFEEVKETPKKSPAKNEEPPKK